LKRFEQIRRRKRRTDRLKAMLRNRGNAVNIIDARGRTVCSPCGERLLDHRNRTEEELIEASREGSREAYDVLSGGYRERLMRFVEVFSGGTADAEAVVQETLMKAYLALKQYRGESGFGTWLFAIAKNEIKWDLRRARPLPLDRPPASGEHDAEEVLLRSEKIRTIFAALNRLPRLQREAILLFRYGDLSCEETARALGTSGGAVRTAIYKGMKTLRKRLMEDGTHEM